MRVIAGSARSLRLKTLEGLETRPTTDRIKETLFNMINPDIAGCRFLDCFSGSGGIGIEALSRGAAEAVFIERSPRAADCIRQNLKTTRLEERAVVLCSDIMTGLGSLEGSGAFDIIFMDPPYDRQLEKRVLICLQSSALADKTTLIIVEASLKTDFSYAEELGFTIARSKEYKTNKHVFLRKA